MTCPPGHNGTPLPTPTDALLFLPIQWVNSPSDAVVVVGGDVGGGGGGGGGDGGGGGGGGDVPAPLRRRLAFNCIAAPLFLYWRCNDRVIWFHWRGGVGGERGGIPGGGSHGILLKHRMESISEWLENFVGRVPQDFIGFIGRGEISRELPRILKNRRDSYDNPWGSYKYPWESLRIPENPEESQGIPKSPKASLRSYENPGESLTFPEDPEKS